MSKETLSVESAWCIYSMFLIFKTLSSLQIKMKWNKTTTTKSFLIFGGCFSSPKYQLGHVTKLSTLLSPPTLVILIILFPSRKISHALIYKILYNCTILSRNYPKSPLYRSKQLSLNFFYFNIFYYMLY